MLTELSRALHIFRALSDLRHSPSNALTEPSPYARRLAAAAAHPAASGSNFTGLHGRGSFVEPLQSPFSAFRASVDISSGSFEPSVRNGSFRRFRPPLLFSALGDLKHAAFTFRQGMKRLSLRALDVPRRDRLSSENLREGPRHAQVYGLGKALRRPLLAVPSDAFSC